MILMLTSLFRLTGRRLDEGLILWLGKLLGVFLLVVIYLLVVENLYRYYLIESREAAKYYLFGGLHSLLFWVGLLIVGHLIPVVVLFHKRTGRRIKWVIFAAALVVFGVLCERYVIVIPGQTNPPHLFPGMVITESPILSQEAGVTYYISIYEMLQALGVLSVIGLMFVFGLKLMKLAPTEARVLEKPTPE
jgi:molybdopterin-containing oxidoreductase family membrane subunit